MATRRPLHALRPLPQQCLSRSQPSCQHTTIPIRTLTSQAAIAEPAKPFRRAATWMRAVAPPKEYISWDMYVEMMRKPASLAHQLAQYQAKPKTAARYQQAQALEEEVEEEKISAGEAELDPSNVRLIPASPSYFSTQPNFNDDMVHLSMLARKYGNLPKIPRLYAPKAAWKPLQAYRLWLGEAIAPSRYVRLRGLLHVLNRILPELRVQEVKDALDAHLKDAVEEEMPRQPGLLDEWGRGFGKGRRKTARAMAYVVEGSGEVLVNERNITDVFGRVKDRECALWPLTATGRMSRYNVFAVVKGGGTTGWAEAMALAVAKAVLVHEPGLKPAMRRAGVVRRDPRKVERKKPGHVKARKMPAWVKR